ncbi:glycosidase [Fibrobacterota bacterium]
MINEIMKRHEGNPLLTAADLPYPANAVFNAGAVKRGKEYLLLLRVEDRKGVSHFTIARSHDGFSNWYITSNPVMVPEPDKYPEERRGLEDPRITFLEPLNTWGVAYTAYSTSGPLVSLALTDDFLNYKRQGAVLPPENKDAGLFPIQFSGRWAMLHRPGPSQGKGKPDIWICFSPDLKHWGDNSVVMQCGGGANWDSGKIGLGPPPILTDEGWLILYHGVKKGSSGNIYRVGAALLERDNPSRLISRTPEWIFGPQAEYERSGDVGNVVFPCGWIPEGDDLIMYYGAADSSICMATSKISRILSLLKESGE